MPPSVDACSTTRKVRERLAVPAPFPVKVIYLRHHGMMRHGSIPVRTEVSVSLAATRKIPHRFDETELVGRNKTDELFHWLQGLGSN
ncbi:hypothetical protein TcasGA2_TC011132 [Tribolium castaneum]|uniref:Uncharacterized protein n=1 Tax=Tribolium castaneum TaxID=7070 RepID=D6X445_TRICA|nr:hypothetical protein TcasGA2_TC011132 [Tribolium castaneum]